MDRYCTNCRAPLPARANRCDACGEIAGDVFDGKIRRPDRPRGNGLLLTLLVLLAAGGAYFWWSRQQETATDAVPVPLPSTRVVADRPGGARRGEGAAVNEAQAIRILQRHLVAEGRRRDCLVVSSHGYRDGAYRLSVLERCEHVRLGRWAVDGASGAVTPDRGRSSG